MTTPIAARPSVLSGENEWNSRIEHASSNDLQQFARFWIGPNPPGRMSDCLKAIQTVLKDPKAIALRLAKLSPQERELLGVFKRYGGTMTDGLIAAEMHARGMVTHIDKSDYARMTAQRRENPYAKLLAKLLIQPVEGRSSYYYGFDEHYQDSVVNPITLPFVDEAKPAAWTPDCSIAAPATSTRRLFAEVVLDLWATAQELERNTGWKPRRDGGIPKALAVKLRKVLPPDPPGPPSVPNTEVLYHELLCGLNIVDSNDNEATVDLASLREQFEPPAEFFAHNLVRSWLDTDLWLDGVGTVSGQTDGYSGSYANQPGARETMIWGLTALARAGDGWSDLEKFLLQLWEVQATATPMFSYSSEWQPVFGGPKTKNRYWGQPLTSDFWLLHVGVWAANTILGTFTHLGLVEHGPVSGKLIAFRLTPLGRSVFGSPEVLPLPTPTERKFFTVQPNYEIVAYLDDALPEAVWPLARIARGMAANPGSPVRTFAFDRTSVYAALESGMTTEGIRDYFIAHGKTTLPPNITRTLEEWGGKRESLVLRRGVTLLTGIPSPPTNARSLGEGFHLIGGSSPMPKGYLTITFPDAARPCWTAGEDGAVRVESDAHTVAVARLGQFAEKLEKGAFQITPDSVAGAKRRGITGEQVLTKLRHNNRGALPPLLAVAIRNWQIGSSVVLDNLLMMQVPDPAAATALAGSAKFKPFFLSYIPPNWFVVDGKRRKELLPFLTSIGYTWHELPTLSVKPGDV